MNRKIFCYKLKKEAEGLKFQIYPGELGKKIFDNISDEAWKLWMSKQTMLINENQFNMMNVEHRNILEQKMIDFLFNNKDIVIDGFVPNSN